MTGAGSSAVREATSVEATFQWPIRIYWEDTDAGGIVFYANYLKFFERARTEWLRSLGIEQQRLKDSTGGFFVVIDTRIRYHRPARLDDELIVTASRGKTGGASMIITQQALLKTERCQDGGSPAGLEAEERRAGPSQASSAPEGLEPAAPSLLEQDWTGDRGEASREPRPARPRAAHAVVSVGALLCEGTIRIGWVNAASLRPAPMPDCILDCLKT